MTDLILNNLPWFWVVVMLVCIVIESLTVTLTTVWFAAGAFVTVFISMTPLAFRWQLLLFMTVSFPLLFQTRTAAVRKLLQKKNQRTNVDALIGMEVLLTKKITEFEKGEIRCDGKMWSAQSADGTGIPVHTVCRIIGIQGNTVILVPAGRENTGRDSREENR